MSRKKSVSSYSSAVPFDWRNESQIHKIELEANAANIKDTTWRGETLWDSSSLDSSSDNCQLSVASSAVAAQRQNNHRCRLSTCDLDCYACDHIALPMLALDSIMVVHVLGLGSKSFWFLSQRIADREDCTWAHSMTGRSNAKGQLN